MMDNTNNISHEIFGDMRYLTPEENERKRDMYRRMSTTVTNSDSMDFCGVACNFAEGLIKKAKSEAIKEFSERLNADCFEKILAYACCNGYMLDTKDDVKKLSVLLKNEIKKMAGEN